MTTLSKDDVLRKIKVIAVLDKEELFNMASVISLSDADDKAKSFLNRAIDLRFAELQGIDTVGLTVVDGDYDVSEL